MLDSTAIAPFLAALDAGRMPRLEPLLLGSAAYSPRVWEAMLAGGGLDVLDLELIERMEAVYFRLELLVDRMKKLETLSVQELLPRTEEARGAFYDEATGRLRERWAWYPRALRAVRDAAAEARAEHARLLALLRARTG